MPLELFDLLSVTLIVIAKHQLLELEIKSLAEKDKIWRITINAIRAKKLLSIVDFR